MHDLILDLFLRMLKWDNKDMISPSFEQSIQPPLMASPAISISLTSSSNSITPSTSPRTKPHPRLLYSRSVELSKADASSRNHVVLHICSQCSKVGWPVAQNEQWISVDEYYQRGGNNDVVLSHCICGFCYKPDVQIKLSTSKTLSFEEDQKKEDSRATWNMGEKKLQVLVVDDSKLQLLVVEKILKDFGMICTLVTSGAEALKCISDKLQSSHPDVRPFDIILMDCVMPGLDGFETTAAIRKMNLSMPIIAISGLSGQEGWTQRCLESGMNDFSLKPVKKTELLNLISKWRIQEAI